MTAFPIPLFISFSDGAKHVKYINVSYFFLSYHSDEFQFIVNHNSSITVNFSYCIRQFYAFLSRFRLIFCLSNVTVLNVQEMLFYLSFQGMFHVYEFVHRFQNFQLDVFASDVSEVTMFSQFSE